METSTSAPLLSAESPSTEPDNIGGRGLSMNAFEAFHNNERIPPRWTRPYLSGTGLLSADSGISVSFFGADTGSATHAASNAVSNLAIQTSTTPGFFSHTSNTNTHSSGAPSSNTIEYKSAGTLINEGYATALDFM